MLLSVHVRSIGDLINLQKLDLGNNEIEDLVRIINKQTDYKDYIIQDYIYSASRCLSLK